MSPRPRKRFAQHWLKSDLILNNILAAANLKKSDRILEIGPGTGIMTDLLLREVEAVLAVEIDRDLCKKLVRKFGDRADFLLLQGNILDFDLDANLVSFPRFQNANKVVANIPYNITGPILQKLLGSIAEPAQKDYELIVLLLQKEVADRLVASPGNKAYGALSVRVQYLATCEYICDVPSKAFYPPPKVDSAVVRLIPKIVENPAKNPKYLNTLLKLGFATRRKMLKNNLKSIIDCDRLTQILEQLDINPNCRAENLSLQNWIALSDRLDEVKSNNKQPTANNE